MQINLFVRNDENVIVNTLKIDAIDYLIIFIGF